MDELIRSRMHEALDVEQPDVRLRSRVLASIPVDQPYMRRSWRFSGQWAGGLVAGLLAIAVVAGLIYSGGARNILGPTTSPPKLSLKAPEGIAVAPDGSIYVSDFAGNYVFRLQPNGSLVLIAGIGKVVYEPGRPYVGPGGDRGLAINANLANPSGLAVDRNGNLFVADSYRSSVRQIDGQGVITTAVGGGPASLNGGDGGPAVAATLQFPLGLAFDSAGALYVGDSGDSKIRRIDPNGTITTLDSSGLPGPSWAPGYLAFDSAGYLYVSDRSPDVVVPAQRFNIAGGCRVVRIGKDGAESVIAGTGTCGFSGDGGPAVAARLDDPNGIAFDSAGNLYFADSNNQRIRRIDRNGIITTIAGTGIAGFSGDGGPGTRAQLNLPYGIGMAPGDVLYIAEGGSGRVRHLRLSDNVITTAAT